MRAGAAGVRSQARRAKRFAARVRASRWVDVPIRIAFSPILWWSAFFIAFGIFITPEVVSRVARERSKACLQRARTARGPQLPECLGYVRDFDFSSRVSYTRHDSTYRAEELIARVAINRYIDGAIGDPSPEKLGIGRTSIARAEKIVTNGSRRISMEELGSSVASPHLGKLASSLGDRIALLEAPNAFDLWYIRRDVLEAAALEADFEAFDEIAIEYANDELYFDLKTSVGAALCMSSPVDGYGVLQNVPQKRAEKRSENMQRNFGEVFAVLVACASKAGASDPEPPDEGNAGVIETPVLRRLAELRTSLAGPARKAKIERAIEMLSSSSGDPIDKDQPYARSMLLASILVLSEEPLDPGLVTKLATPRTGDGEGPLAPKAATLRTILVRPPNLYPSVPTPWLDKAADALKDLASEARNPRPKTKTRTASNGGSGESRERGSSGGGLESREGEPRITTGPDDPPPPRPDPQVLEAAAAALRTLGAIEHAMDGDLEDAVRDARDGGTGAKLSPRFIALSTASAAYVAGDPAMALSLLDAAPKSTPEDDGDVEIAISTLEALVAASAGDHERSERVASALPLMANDANDVEVALHARWVALAIAPQTLPKVSGPLVLYPMGQADPLMRYRERGEPAITATMSSWATAIGSSPEEKRAFRYRLFERRGDLPSLAFASILAAQQLIDDTTSGDGAEIWLDAITAIDARRMRLRSYAWMRMEAARIRGDAPSTTAWHERLALLRQVAENPDDLEATRFLRF